MSPYALSKVADQALRLHSGNSLAASKLAASPDALKCSLAAGRSIAFVSGNFNILHPGHLRMLRFASDIAQVVVVGVHPDGYSGVNVPFDVRVEGLASIHMVTHIVALRDGLDKALESLRPDFVVKGKEFEGSQNIEEALVASYGGQLVFSSGEAVFSDLALLEKEFREPNFSSIRMDRAYPNRHGFSIKGLKRALSRMAGIRVLVIGDLIIDDYITCEPLGMSQEDPTIVVSPIETKTFVGGAGVVSAHAQGLGGDVRYCTVVGQDEAATYARAQLEAQNIALDFVTDATRPTSRKQRFRAHNKTLLRVNHLRQHSVSRDVSFKLLRAIEAALPTTDLILFSDFNYGCLPQALVDAVVELASARNIMMTADSQASSQMSDISRFKGMSLITPTEREARLAMNDFDNGLAYLSETLAGKSAAQNVVITLGAEGLLLWAKNSDLVGADRLPAFNTAPKDPAGAGDSLLTAASLALRAGIDIWQSVYIGGLAAACQVSRVGNTPLSLRDLTAEIDLG